MILLTAVWGSTFPLLKEVVTRVPVTDFLAVRFALAAAALALIYPRGLRLLSPADRRRGLCGRPSHWPRPGLAVLALRGLSLGGGELLTLLAALLYAVHLLGLGLWSTARNAVGLTTVQLAMVSAVCGLGALPGGLVLPPRGSDWLVLVYMALAAGTGALLLQTWAQAHLAAARAAIIMTLEPVWAGVFAVLIGGESLGPRVLIGGGLVLAAMYLIESGPRAPEPQARPGVPAKSA